MIRRTFFSILLSGSIVCGATTTAYGQAQSTQTPARLDVDGTITRAVIETVLGDQTPKRGSAPADQVQVQSNSNGDSVAAPSFPKLVGLAIDNGLAGVSGGAITLKLTPFAFRALATPSQLLPANYANSTNTYLRRIGGSLTLGGKGDSFDRDGDGKADPAQTADFLGDIVKADVSFRILGTRDRLDAKALAAYVAATETREPAALMAFRELRAKILEKLPKMADAEGNRYVPASEADALHKELDGLKTDPTYTAFVEAIKASQAAQQSVIKDIDRASIWSVTSGVVRQKRQFGRDQWHVGAEGAFPLGTSDGTLNVDYVVEQPIVDGQGDRRSFKFAVGFTRVFGDPSDDSPDTKLTFSSSVSHYWNAPDITHSKIVKAGATLTLPLSDTIAIPLSVTYANFADQLSTAPHGVIRGNVALTWDFSSLAVSKAKQ